jgi:hypothetical protein
VISRSLTRDYLSAKLVLRPGGLLPSCPLSAQDEQTLCNIFTNLAVRSRVGRPRRFSELAIFDARLHIRVRRSDEPA